MSQRSILLRQIEDLEAALRIAQNKIQEQAEIMTDLLLKIGSRKSCRDCEVPVFWILVRGGGPALALNLDGTEHWPRCPQVRAIALESKHA